MTQQVKVIATKSDNLNSISRACNGKKRTNSQKLSSDNGTHAHTDTEQILKEIQTNSLKKKTGQWLPLKSEMRNNLYIHTYINTK